MSLPPKSYDLITMGRSSIDLYANDVGARFVDTVGLDAFARALAAEPRVRLVVLTRLATTYEMLDATTIREVILFPLLRPEVE